MDENAQVFSDNDLEKEIRKYNKEIFELVDNTRKHKVEHGFTLCWDKEKKTTYINEICKGEHSCVNLKGCQYPYQFATIHVHPKGGGWVPSPKDVIGSLSESEAVFCVGAIGTTRKKDAFQCYTLTDETEPRQKYCKAWQDDDWMTTSSMIGDSVFKPGKNNILRPIFRLFRN
ncbi:MAG: hypothetical protein IMZ53_01110 [Thermoplasmata archaeon]|nr:hypothetical protein [Thermoplasmata archaeon]